MCENAHPHTFLRNFASHQIPYSMPALGKILIIDDNEDVLFALHLLLEPYAEKVKVMRSPDRIVHFITDFRPDIVLLDMNFTRDTVSGQEGMDCLQEILKLDRHAVVVMMTAYADTDKAVQAIKAGATDFVSKPWENDKLLATLHAAMKLRRSQTEVGRLEERVEALSAERETPQPLLIGESEGMRNIVSTIGRLREADVNVLLLGENGTGKDVVARYLLAHSSRAAEPFVTIDVGAVPETLFESELFGYEKGAFTDARKEKKGRLELAHGGTLFLDEVGNLSPAAQSKLLTALEKRRIVRLGGTREIPIDVRLICATHADLHAQVTEGTFRQDLFYRINTVEIHIPPLRERGEDIQLLADHFLRTYARKYKKDIEKMEQEIEYRKCVVRKEKLEAVKEARAQGDLSENFEYYAAKKDKNANERRIRYLDRLVRTADIIDDTSADDEVGIDNTVTVYFEDDDEEETYRVVTSVRADVLDGRVSNVSPIGRAIMGHKVGDRVQVVPEKGEPYYLVIRKIENTQDDGSFEIN